MALTWYIEIDWSNTSTFVNENGRLLDLRIRRGRQHMLAANGKGFEPFRAGELKLTLDSYDRRFDPFYSSSALYPNVKPGRDVRVRVNDGTSTYTLFRGSISEIMPDGGTRTVKLTVLDGWDRLQNVNVRHATQTNIGTNTAIDSVLTDAAYPAAWGRSLQTGSDVIPFWWASDERAADALRDLTDSEFGTFYIAADGTATFKNRASAYNVSAAVTINQSNLLKEMTVSRPWETLRNVARIAIAPQSTVRNATLWTLNEKTYVKYNTTVTLVANLKYNTFPAILTGANGAANLTMNTLDDNSGTPIVPTVTLTTYGSVAQIAITNNDAAAKDAYITALLVTGDAIYVPDATTVEYDSSAGSEYGTRVFNLNLRWQQAAVRAIDFAKYITTFLGSSRLRPVVQMENRWSTQFGYDLTAAVNFVSAYWGVNNLYRIMGVEHECVAGPQGLRTTWYLEPTDETVYWKIGTSKVDTETIVAY